MEEILVKQRRIRHALAITRFGIALLNIIVWASLWNWLMLAISLVLAWLVCVTLRDWFMMVEYRYIQRMLEIYKQEVEEYDVDAPIVVYWVARVVFFVSVLVLFGMLAAGVYVRFV